MTTLFKKRFLYKKVWRNYNLHAFSFFMHIRLSSVIATGLLLFASPLLASAHEHQTFLIGEKQYSITIGSRGEPVYVDDKSGVEVMIEELGAADHEATEHVDGDEHEEGTPVVGLEKTLKVEVSAGEQKKEMELSPAYGAPGEYYAVFVPTVQTTYTYRLFGTINEIPVDLSFTCNPAGHPATPEDTTHQSVGEKVTRIAKAGAFGCPRSRTEIFFPEPAATASDLSTRVQELEKNKAMVTTALILGILGFVFSVGALTRAKKKMPTA